MDIIIKGLRIHTANEQLENASIAIDNGKIVALNSNYSADHVIEFPADHHLNIGIPSVLLRQADPLPRAAMVYYLPPKFQLGTPAQPYPWNRVLYHPLKPI